MVDLGLFADAGPILEEAKRFVRMLEERSSIAILDLTDGQREMALGRWDRAVRLWERGLQALKERGDLSDYARSLVCVARFFLENGDIEQTQRLLEEAEPIAQKLGGTLLIETTADLRRRLGSRVVPASTSRRTET